jgi:hypothetical protein
MRFSTFDFRHAEEILRQRDEWVELRNEIESIARDEVIATHHDLVQHRRRPPAGAQTAINAIFRRRLQNWIAEPRLFSGDDERMRGWKMDFLKNRLGVEVSFNHAEAVPWTFTRLNIAGESQEVVQEHRIDVGVALFAMRSLKTWGRMDEAVGTFELACEWLRHMRPIMPIPVLVVGLSAEAWEPTDAFRGTRKSSQSNATEQSEG